MREEDDDRVRTEMKDVPRVPMGRAEYWAMKYMAAIISCNGCCEALKDRLKSIPNGWRNFRAVQSLTTWVFERLCFTIPARQLVPIGEDLKRTECYLTTRGAARDPREQHDFCVIPRTEYLALVQMLVDANCPTCDRQGKECRRCKLRRILEATLPYKLPEGNGTCPFNDYAVDSYYSAEELMKINSYNEFKGEEE